MIFTFIFSPPHIHYKEQKDNLYPFLYHITSKITVDIPSILYNKNLLPRYESAMIGFSSISLQDFRNLVNGANQYRTKYELVFQLICHFYLFTG